MKDVASVLKKWQDNSTNSVQAYKDGVQKVTSSPTAKAAANLTVAAQNYQQAVSSGRMAAKLNAVTLSQWQQAAMGKGAANFQNGIRAASPKMQTFLTAFLPVADQVKQEVASLPKGGPNDWQARVAVAVNRFRQFAGKQ